MQNVGIVWLDVTAPVTGLYLIMRPEPRYSRLATVRSVLAEPPGTGIVFSENVICVGG